MAYGTDPVWAQFPWGFGFIVGVYQWQWPLAIVSLLLCLGLIGLVVLGKHRAWWLVALGPILALFIQRFHTDPYRHMIVLDHPDLVAAADGGLKDDEMIVGVLLSGDPVAYPYRALYKAPVVLQTSRDQRVTMVLMWSAMANRARAFSVSRELKSRDLAVVSMPANALLVYNSRLGQFINGLTGQTPSGVRPTGFIELIPTQKMTWAQWRSAYPSTKVLPAPAGGNAPTDAIKPNMPMPEQKLVPAPQTRIVLVSTTRPVAVESSKIDDQPVNAIEGGNHILLLRDPRTHLLRAFDRQVEPDLFPRFSLRDDPQHHICLADSDTGSLWSLDGKALKGPYAATADQAAKTLRALPVEEDLTWGVMKYWMPELQIGKVLDPVTPSRPPTESPSRGTSGGTRRGPRGAGRS